MCCRFIQVEFSIAIESSSIIARHDLLEIATEWHELFSQFAFGACRHSKFASLLNSLFCEPNQFKYCSVWIREADERSMGCRCSKRLWLGHEGHALSLEFLISFLNIDSEKSYSTDTCMIHLLIRYTRGLRLAPFDQIDQDRGRLVDQTQES